MKLISSNIELKPLKESDLEFIYEMSSNCLVYKYEEDSKPTKEQVFKKYRDKIKSMEDNENESFTMLISRFKDSKAMGEIHIHLDNKRTRCWEIGYSLHPDYWGNGYALEAARLLMKYVFEEQNAHKVMGCCNAKNIKSAKCMERIGMLEEGCIREGRLLNGEWCDELVYSILDKDYNKRKL